MRASKIDSRSYALKILEQKGIDAVEDVWLDSLDRNCIVGIRRGGSTIFAVIYDFDPNGYELFIEDDGEKHALIEEVMAKADFEFAIEDAIYSWSIMQIAETSVNDKVFTAMTCTSSFEAVTTGEEIKKTKD